MKKTYRITLAVIAILVLATIGGSVYMLNFSLSPDPNRTDLDSTYAILYKHFLSNKHPTKLQLFSSFSNIFSENIYFHAKNPASACH